MAKRESDFQTEAFVGLFVAGLCGGLLAGEIAHMLKSEPVVEPCSAPQVVFVPVVRERQEEQVVVVMDVEEEETKYFDEVPLTHDEWDSLTEACERFSVDRALLLGLIEQETQFRNITGDGGNSIGYCQIQPRWWSGLMSEIGAKDLTDPKDNFMTACAIIKKLCDRYGDTELALTAYNSGKAGQSKYADSVLANTAKWSKVLYGV